MKPAKISVLTPVLNGEAFIDNCLKSVIEQDCNQAEHIICDGGSTDNTCSIVEKYTAKYPHIRFYSQKDSGQSEAMNQAISLAEAPTIGFLNVDDFYNPGVLNRIIQIFDTAPEPSLAMGNCNLIGETGKPFDTNVPQARNMEDILKGKSVPYNPSAYFYHKSLHDIIGYYDKNDHYVMDLDFLLRAFNVANILYFNETWGNFRFIKGRKTFDDHKEGNMWLRKEALIEKHLRALPKGMQYRIKAYTIAVHVINKIKGRLLRS